MTPVTAAEDWTFGALKSFRGRVLLSDKPVKLYRWRADGLSKQAVYDLRALYDARRVTRRAVRDDGMAPAWMKMFIGVIAVLHLLELPLHIRRERAFSDPKRIRLAARRVATPVPISAAQKVRPVASPKLRQAKAAFELQPARGKAFAKAIGQQAQAVAGGTQVVATSEGSINLRKGAF